MVEALKLVQKDLDETGLNQRQMTLTASQWGFDADDQPYLTQVVATEVDPHGGHDDIGDGLLLEAITVDELVPSVARSVGYCLMQRHESIYWPMCPEHDRRMSASEDDHPASWRCNPKAEPSHLVAPIGELSSILRRYRQGHPIWTGLRRP
jgi:hypothetical protein